MSQATSELPVGAAMAATSEVLTLAEAAEYLRVCESDVLELAERHELPGRRIGSHWRFHRQGLARWLQTPAHPDFWSSQWAALRDDPDLDGMLQQIYTERGRPMAEEG